MRGYAAKNDEELTFKEGDIIFVPQRTDGPMWKGVFNGKVGVSQRWHRIMMCLLNQAGAKERE